MPLWQVDLDGQVLNGAAVDDLSDSSGSDEDMQDACRAQPKQLSQQPVIDDDGFQLVQSRGRRRGPPSNGLAR